MSRDVTARMESNIHKKVGRCGKRHANLFCTSKGLGLGGFRGLLMDSVTSGSGGFHRVANGFGNLLITVDNKGLTALLRGYNQWGVSGDKRYTRNSKP